MDKRILLWLLPIIDIVKRNKVKRQYERWGCEKIPKSQPILSAIERPLGYSLSFFILCYFFPLTLVLKMLVFSFIVGGSIEFTLMNKGFWPWKFFKTTKSKVVAKIFLLEAYNTLSYIITGIIIYLIIF